jgi:HTH-type transcriptional regulator / antitoxin HigA
MEGITLILSVSETQKIWQPLADNLVVPRNEEQYERLVAWLDNLIDEVGENETHPLASLMDVLSVLIERYETEFVPELQE